MKQSQSSGLNSLVLTENEHEHDYPDLSKTKICKIHSQ